MTKTTCLHAFLTVAILCAFAAPAHAGDATVPDCVGLGLDEARQLVEGAGFKVAVQPAPGRPAGVVFSQQPGGLATRSTGSTVTLMVGGSAPKPTPEPTPEPKPDPTPDPKPDPKPEPGPGTTDGPISTPSDDLGAPPAGAGAVPVEPVPSEPARETPRDDGGMRAAPGSTALVWNGKAIPPGSMPSMTGPAVPDVLNQNAQRARRILGRWQVKVEQSLALPEFTGRVINQVPPAGTQLAQSGTITIVVAVAKAANDAVFVPLAQGRDWRAACEEIRRAGLTPDPRSVASADDERGRVMLQTPQPSSLVSPGATVTVMVGRGSGAYSAEVVPGSEPTPRPDPTPDPTPEPEPDPTPEPKPVDPIDEGPPAGSGTAPIETGPTEPAPTEPGPTEPAPAEPKPADPKPEPTPEPMPVPEPDPEPEPVQLGAPSLKTPPAGESYPYKYGADFSWSAVSGASGYELELQEEQPSGAWATVSTERVVAPKYRPSKLKRGRYRWRVRAMGAEDAGGKWSDFRRLYMY